MKLFTTVCLALGVAAAKASDVIVALDSDYEALIADNQYVLMEFYAPWCGHCKSLAPEYEKAATALAGFEPNVVLAKCDATENKAVAEKFEVKGFPTLKWFQNGKAKEYGGGRTEETIVSWIKKKVGPAATTLKTVDELKELKDSADVVIVGVFKTEAEKDGFMAAAADEESLTYAYTVGNDDVIAAVGAKNVPGVVVFQKFDEGRADFEGDVSDSAAIAEFVAGNSLPLVIPFTQENAPKIFGGSIKSHLLIFVDSTKASQTEPVLKEAKASAVDFKGKALFVTIDKTDDRIMEFFGVVEADLPTVRVVKMTEEGINKYKYQGEEITSAAISKLLNDFFDGKLSADLKSEDPIADADQSGVWVLAGTNFEEVVAKPDTDVLVEFYAPWCGHCKKLVPIYDELAAKYADNDKLIIAKMDSTANEVERIQVSGFPTLKFFPANSDKVVDYEGGRDLEGFVSFLEENVASLSKSS